MIVGIKNVLKLVGIVIISACAVFVCTLFLNYNLDLAEIEELISGEEMRAMYDAMVMSGTVVIAVSGGCLLITAAVMLVFYVKHYIDAHRKELGILKALGYSNFKIALGFWAFGLSVLFGTAVGFFAAHLFMPKFYETQNKDGMLPAFEAGFHIELPVFLVILPTVVFAALSVLYALIKLKTPVMDLLKGKVVYNTKGVRIEKDLPFLKEMRSVTVRSRKSLVFFIAFASFCYSAMVQMSFGVNKLSSGLMSAMVLVIGLVLAFMTLFIAAVSVVGSNAKSTAIMRVFGYSGRDCSAAVLGGYRPAALIGFAVGTGYQYLLLRIAVDVVFKDIEGVPEFNFDFRALIIAALSFVIVYETVMFFCSRKIGRTPVKEIMLDSE